MEVSKLLESKLASRGNLLRALRDARSNDTIDTVKMYIDTVPVVLGDKNAEQVNFDRCDEVIAAAKKIGLKTSVFPFSMDREEGNGVFYKNPRKAYAPTTYFEVSGNASKILELLANKYINFAGTSKDVVAELEYVSIAADRR